MLLTCLCFLLDRERLQTSPHSQIAPAALGILTIHFFRGVIVFRCRGCGRSLLGLSFRNTFEGPGVSAGGPESPSSLVSELSVATTVDALPVVCSSLATQLGVLFGLGLCGRRIDDCRVFSFSPTFRGSIGCESCSGSALTVSTGISSTGATSSSCSGRLSGASLFDWGRFLGRCSFFDWSRGSLFDWSSFFY